MKLYVTFLLLFLCSNSTYSQSFYLKQYTIEDGLPSYEVYQVIEDNFGNLLVATDRGISKFDGYSFESVPSEKGQTITPFFYIYKAPTGKIFFSGPKGYIYEYGGNALADYRHNNTITNLFQHSGLLIANTLAYTNDTMWLSYNNDFIHNFQIGTCIVLPDGSVKKWLTKDGIYFDMQRKFYFRQFSGTGLKKEQNLHITWPDGTTTIDTITLPWDNGYIRRLYYQQLNNFDIFFIGRKIRIYKNKRKLSEYNLDEHILTTTVVNGELYLGFEHGGAAVYHLNNGKLSDPVDSFLEKNTVTSIYQDQQGGIWFATHDNGIYYRYSSKAQFEQKKEKIHRIVKDTVHVYICYRDGSMEKYAAGKLVEVIPSTIPNSEFLKTVGFDQNHNIILFSTDNKYSIDNRTWKYGPYSSISYVSDTLLYAASSSRSELYQLSHKTGQIIRKYILPKRIISTYFDSRTETLWLGTWEGLFTLKDKVLSRYHSTNLLFSDRIISIGQMANGTIAVATLGSGLALIRDGKSQVINTTNGLYSSLINSMSIDGNTIWLSSNKGITKLSNGPDKMRSVHYGKDAGLPSSNINEFSAHKGWIYYKWDDKLVMLSAENLDKRHQPTVTRMTKVMARGQSLDQNFPAKLPYNNNDIEFFFTSTNLAAAKEQIYQYKLVGFDNDWQTTAERYVKYTNIPPGNYTFVVEAFNTSNSSRTSALNYQFTIVPAIWQQWWFFPVTFLLLISVLFYLFKLRLKRVKERNRLLLSIAESKQVALVQLINPHFIFNVLNTIQGAVLKQDKLSAASIISKFGRLMRMSMELSKMKMVSLTREIEMIDRYFELEQIRAPNKFTYEIVLDDDLNPNTIHIPAMLIQPFVENAIKHGIMHMHGTGGIVKIRFSLLNGLLYCTVEDNGIGRYQAEQINEKIRPEHESAGIHITVERLKLLHKENSSKFEYTVIDKEDDEGTPTGTSILFTLPYKINYGSDQSSNN